MPQENNMAEVIRLLHTVIGKVDGVASGLERVEADVGVLKTEVGGLKTEVGGLKTEVGGLKTDVRNLNVRFDRLEDKVDVFSGQFQDVVRVVIENTQRIEGLEGRVEILESKAN